jgi:hypothetical protein
LDDYKLSSISKISTTTTTKITFTKSGGKSKGDTIVPIQVSDAAFTAWKGKLYEHATQNGMLKQKSDPSAKILWTTGEKEGLTTEDMLKEYTLMTEAKSLVCGCDLGVWKWVFVVLSLAAALLFVVIVIRL